MKKSLLYRGFRYPAEIISYVVWLYFRFALSFRDIEELMASRGIIVTYDTIRQWTLKFGQGYANEFRLRQPQRGDKWHLDEVVLTIKGKHYYLTSASIWRRWCINLRRAFGSRCLPIIRSGQIYMPSIGGVILNVNDRLLITLQVKMRNFGHGLKTHIARNVFFIVIWSAASLPFLQCDAAQWSRRHDQPGASMLFSGNAGLPVFFE